MAQFIKKFHDIVYRFDELGVSYDLFPASHLKNLLGEKKDTIIKSAQLISGELNPYIYNTDGNTTRLFFEEHKDDNFDFKIHAGPRIWLDNNNDNKMFDFIESLEAEKKDLNIMVEHKHPIHLLKIDDDVYIFDNHKNFELDRSDLTMMACKTNDIVEDFIETQLSKLMFKNVDSYKSSLITITNDDLDDLANVYNSNRGIESV